MENLTSEEMLELKRALKHWRHELSLSIANAEGKADHARAGRLKARVELVNEVWRKADLDKLGGAL